MSTKQEVDIGRRGGQRLEKKYGLSKQRRYAYRINAVGKRLAAVQSRKDIRYHFKVLNSKKFNALAFPGGYIYATRGLMDKLNDGELAFVMGHETGHIVHKHSIRQAEKQLLTTLGIFAITAAVNKGRINQGSANTALLLSYVMRNQYSQADERTADAEGVKYMAEAGYNPKYAVSAMKKLKKAGGGGLGPLNTFLGSHPLPNNRIAAVEREGKKVAFKPSPDDPPVLTGKDYDRGTAMSKGGSKNYRTEKTVKMASTGGKSVGGGGGEVVLGPDDADDDLKRISYRNLKANDLRGGSTLPAWENDIRKSLSSVSSNISFDKKLDKEAFRLTFQKAQPVVSNKRIVWVGLAPGNKTREKFVNNFRKNVLPLILSRRSDFTRAGVSVKKNAAGYVHVVVVLK